MKSKLAKYIDHTNLQPSATKKDIKLLCSQAKAAGFFSVCVNPSYVSLAKQCLEGSLVKIACVVGFPLGETFTFIKAHEAALAVDNGASEIDMVISISRLIDGDYNYVLNDIKSVVQASKVPVKVIFEICKLNETQIKKAVELSVKAGAKFIKTSTGFLGDGATADVVSFMSECAKGRIAVKASGGIRDLETAKIMIASGATRLGTSAGLNILQEEKGFLSK